MRATQRAGKWRYQKSEASDPRPNQRRGTEQAAEALEPYIGSDRKTPAWEAQGTFDGARVERACPRPPRAD